jgi:hypothetical protein
VRRRDHSRTRERTILYRRRNNGTSSVSSDASDCKYYRLLTLPSFVATKKIERDSSVTLTRGSLTQNTLELTRSSFDSEGSIGQMNARSKTMARRVEKTIKSAGHVNTTHFRLARIGPGWVLGSIEGASGNQNTGRHVVGTS